MSDGDLQDLTLGALRDAYQQDVQALFRNYIKDVIQSTGDSRKLERARTRFEHGLELSQDSLATLTGIAIKHRG